MTKFKVGDKVRVREDLIPSKDYDDCWFNPDMKIFRGKTYTIAKAYKNCFGERYEFEGIRKWVFSNSMLELANDKSFVLKAGDKVTYLTFWGTKSDLEVINLAGDTIEQFEDDGSKVLKVERTQVVYEAEKEILDEVEKKYLERVINPFRKRIKCIRKRTSLSSRKNQFIQIIYYEGGEELGMGMPDFKKDTMYKGMETNREYSLEELGL